MILTLLKVKTVILVMMSYTPTFLDLVQRSGPSRGRDKPES